MNGYMLDTNIFNHLVEGGIKPEDLPSVPIFSAHLQPDEIQNTTDLDKREKLLSFFKTCDPSETMVMTFVVGDARLEKTQLGEGELHAKILNNLNSREIRKSNNKEAQIAESSYLNGLTLVTDDRDLEAVCYELEIPVISLDQLLNLM